MPAGDDTTTVTFRIPISLKRSLSKHAESLQKTETAVLIQAIENEIESKPPRWFEEWQARRIK